MIRLISESIIHIEDLPLDKFLSTIKNLNAMRGTEKLDGAELILGLDEDGRFFTSREGKRKGSDRRYSVDEWPKVSQYNQFKAAHAALEQVQSDIKEVLSPGEMVELEVLFGNQPNAVTYGLDNKSYIAFLRGVEGTSNDVMDRLTMKLANKQVQCSVQIIDSTDGKELNDIEVDLTFQFVSPQKINTASLTTQEVDAEVKKLQTFLDQDSKVTGKSNAELLELKLTDVPKEKREQVKAAKEELSAQIQSEYKLKIKNTLLSTVVQKLKSSLSSVEIKDEENIGVEGVVLLDPQTGEQVKIVDKDTFTTINKFNQAVRGQISSSLMSTDPTASLERRGGITGAMRIRIAEILGNREFAKNANVKKALEAVKGGSPEEAIKNLAGTMTGIRDYQQVKKQILGVLQATYKTLDEKLDEFKAQKDEYRLRLKTGKNFGLSEDTVKKTLLAFAEARRNINSDFDKIKVAKSLPQLLAVLYGRAAKEVHSAPDKLEEAVKPKFKKFSGFKKIKAPKPKTIKKVKPKKELGSYGGDNGLALLDNKDTFQLVNSYLTTVFMSMLIIHEQDPIGRRKLRDRVHASLKGWSVEMSPLNLWGLGVWKSNLPAVKSHLQNKTEAEIQRITKQFQPSAWKFLHLDLSLDGQGREIHWDDHFLTLTRLINLSGLRTDRLNTVLKSMINWPSLSFDEKTKSLNQLYFLAQMFVPRSSLFQRLKVIQSNLLLNSTGHNPEMIIEGLLKSIAMEADSSSAGSDVSAPGVAMGSGVDAGGSPDFSGGNTNATTAGAVNKRETELMAVKRPVVKRKRNPAVKELIKKFKDPRKSKPGKHI